MYYNNSKADRQGLTTPYRGRAEMAQVIAAYKSDPDLLRTVNFEPVHPVLGVPTKGPNTGFKGLQIPRFYWE